MINLTQQYQTIKKGNGKVWKVRSAMMCIGESATDIVANGWSQTQLSGEWDFLHAIDCNEANQSVSVSAKNPEGRSFFEFEPVRIKR